ncbi:MAG: hypothetical protein IJZ74_10715 [Clostridia bacterium]|nr:hypothetical protein [Clostridia bacterium]
MIVTVSDVMRRVRNHFVTGFSDGQWVLSGGILSPAAFSPGDWIAITQAGALCGVYQLDERGMLPDCADGQWDGRIWLLSPPADFLRLCREIAQWAAKHEDPTLVSERFGQYSRSQSSPAWERVFAAALAPYTRMYTEVTL